MFLMVINFAEKCFKEYSSNWLAFYQALEMNKACWGKNHYLDVRSSKIVNQTLEKTIIGSKVPLKTTSKEHKN